MEVVGEILTVLTQSVMMVMMEFSNEGNQRSRNKCWMLLFQLMLYEGHAGIQGHYCHLNRKSHILGIIHQGELTVRLAEEGMSFSFQSSHQLRSIYPVTWWDENFDLRPMSELV